VKRRATLIDEAGHNHPPFPAPHRECWQYKMKYMIDTCIFNHIRDEHYCITDLPTGEYFITHVQFDEINACPKSSDRDPLLELLKQISSKHEATSVFICGTSRCGQAKVGNGENYQKILESLNKRKRKKNNFKDAIIGETAMSVGHTLLTGDSDFAEVMKSIWDAGKVVFWRK